MSQFSIKPFSQLSLLELHACLKLRGEVFVVGQRICDVADVDDMDPHCHHAMLRQDERLVGTARLLIHHLDHANARALGIGRGQHQIKIGRVAIAPAYQRRGLGTALMQAIQAWMAEQAWPARGEMSAQAHLAGWYTRLGWVRVGEVYQEAGIDHVKMVFGPASSRRG